MLEEAINQTANIPLENYMSVAEEFLENLSYWAEFYMHRRATAFLKGKNLKQAVTNWGIIDEIKCYIEYVRRAYHGFQKSAQDD